MSIRHLLSYIVTLASVVVLGGGTPTAQELDLAGTWQLAESGKPERGVKAEVPGGVYAALLAAGHIPDPYYGQNEKAVQWVPGKNWVFTRAFTLPDGFEDARLVTLRLEDVDCFAEVVLNGVKLGETENRFRRWDYDVTKVLRRGENRLELTFLPTARKSTARRSPRNG